MRRNIFSACAAFLGLAVLLALGSVSPARADITFEPHAISPERGGSTGRIHTDIPRSCGLGSGDVMLTVEGASLTGLHVFYDDCGNLVAGFNIVLEEGQASVGVVFETTGAGNSQSQCRTFDFFELCRRNRNFK